jgi:hypothetical protein
MRPSTAVSLVLLLAWVASLTLVLSRHRRGSEA